MRSGKKPQVDGLKKRLATLRRAETFRGQFKDKPDTSRRYIDVH